MATLKVKEDTIPYQNLTFGADPEVFLVRSDGTPQSVEGLLGGSKHDPKPMENLPEGFFIQEDNVAAEYNIPTTQSSAEFSMAIARGLKYIEACAKAYKLKPKLTSALHFPIEQLMTEHAQKLGCEPDFNAWTVKVNPRPIPPKTLRTAAGHVHIGWKGPIKPPDQLDLVKYLDVVLALPSLLVFPKTERRDLYGKAGAFRPKGYGVEYRVLGNEWLGDRRQREWVQNTIVQATRVLNSPRGVSVREALEDFGDDIQITINDHDIGSALQLMEQFGVKPMPASARARKATTKAE